MKPMGDNTSGNRAMGKAQKGRNETLKVKARLKDIFSLRSTWERQ